MKQFLNLLWLNWLLIRRNKLIEVSVIVTALYMLVFHWLQMLPSVDKLLVLIIFNDPAILGFLFVGVMVLLERDENTLQALGTLPMRKSHYIWAKSLLLTLIALVCCLAMAIIAKGSDCHYGHFVSATILTSLFFTFIGFAVVARVRDFNKYILLSVAVILLLSLPFFGYFGLGERAYYMLMPTQAAIDMYRLAFVSGLSWGELIYAYTYLIISVFASFWLAMRRFDIA
jgi:fluoroquinolone transport system permease protein